MDRLLVIVPLHVSALLGHATLQRDDFDVLYLLLISLALLTALLCLPVDTKPRPPPSFTTTTALHAALSPPQPSISL